MCTLILNLSWIYKTLCLAPHRKVKGRKARYFCIVAKRQAQQSRLDSGYGYSAATRCYCEGERRKRERKYLNGKRVFVTYSQRRKRNRVEYLLLKFIYGFDWVRGVITVGPMWLARPNLLLDRVGNMASTFLMPFVIFSQIVYYCFFFFLEKDTIHCIQLWAMEEGLRYLITF